jgi:hypothetical protein
LAEKTQFGFEPERAVNPLTISLDPNAEGLYDAPALTLAEASKVVRGIEALWPDGAPTGAVTGAPAMAGAPGGMPGAGGPPPG